MCINNNENAGILKTTSIGDWRIRNSGGGGGSLNALWGYWLVYPCLLSSFTRICFVVPYPILTTVAYFTQAIFNVHLGDKMHVLLWTAKVSLLSLLKNDVIFGRIRSFFGGGCTLSLSGSHVSMQSLKCVSLYNTEGASFSNKKETSFCIFKIRNIILSITHW